MISSSDELTPEERQTYEWQMWVPGVGEAGQRRLKAASVLVTRAGGLGGLAAYELAAAGVGRIVLAHAGVVKRGDLNRQVLMTHAALGSSRVECAAQRLRELNPQRPHHAAFTHEEGPEIRGARRDRRYAQVPRTPTNGRT